MGPSAYKAGALYLSTAPHVHRNTAAHLKVTEGSFTAKRLLRTVVLTSNEQWELKIIETGSILLDDLWSFRNCYLHAH